MTQVVRFLLFFLEFYPFKVTRELPVLFYPRTVIYLAQLEVQRMELCGKSVFFFRVVRRIELCVFARMEIELIVRTDIFSRHHVCIIHICATNYCMLHVTASIILRSPKAFTKLDSTKISMLQHVCLLTFQQLIQVVITLKLGKHTTI